MSAVGPSETNNTDTDVENGSQPPSYEKNTSDPPPSYNNIFGKSFGKLKEEKEKSDGNVSFVKGLMVCLCSSLALTILVGLYCAIPISQIVMGAVYIDDCPAEKMIPIYLIVAGCFGVAKCIHSLVGRTQKSQDELEEDQSKVNPLVTIVDCFLFAWFIAGCVFIYRTDNRSDNKADDNYCDSTLYWYAFWITTVNFIIAGVMCCCVCSCISITICCVSKKVKEIQQDQALELKAEQPA